MSKFFVPGKNEQKRARISAMEKEKILRAELEAKHPEECAQVTSKLTQDDSEKTIESCLGFLISGGFTQAHAATYIQGELTKIMAGKRERNEVIDRDIEAN